VNDSRGIRLGRDVRVVPFVFGENGFARGGQQMRKKGFGYVANDGIDDPGKHKRHGAAEFDRFDLNVSAAGFFLDVPPGAKLPEIAA
jgi:hypothetical protein